jgi:hypothetical protein
MMRRGKRFPEIEVTPEMIKAGHDAMAAHAFTSMEGYVPLYMLLSLMDCRVKPGNDGGEA